MEEAVWLHEGAAVEAILFWKFGILMLPLLLKSRLRMLNVARCMMRRDAARGTESVL